MKVICYTDGSCLGNPGPGGWAYSLQCGEHRKVSYGGAPHSTNNAMELSAALAAVRAIKKPCTLIMHSDSAYLVSNYSRVPYWKANGWVGRTGSVKNAVLWRELEEEVQRRGIDLRLVKVEGHAGISGNEEVDALARQQAEAYKAALDEA